MTIQKGDHSVGPMKQDWCLKSVSYSLQKCSETVFRTVFLPAGVYGKNLSFLLVSFWLISYTLAIRTVSPRQQTLHIDRLTEARSVAGSDKPVSIYIKESCVRYLLDSR